MTFIISLALAYLAAGIVLSLLPFILLCRLGILDSGAVFCEDQGPFLLVIAWPYYVFLGLIIVPIIIYFKYIDKYIEKFNKWVINFCNVKGK